MEPVIRGLGDRRLSIHCTKGDTEVSTQQLLDTSLLHQLPGPAYMHHPVWKYMSQKVIRRGADGCCLAFKFLVKMIFMIETSKSIIQILYQR